MATIEELPFAKPRLSPSSAPVNNLSVILIGKILSHMTCARDVVMASATCVKWRTAARKYLRKVVFTKSDFRPTRRGRPAIGGHELGITEAIFRISSLEEMSICLDLCFEFRAAVVVAWLLHLKEALRSLTLMINIIPKLNVVEKLGGTHSRLEHLEWGPVYIDSINPNSCNFSSLVSLSLKGTGRVVEGSIEALLIACPNLELLRLQGICISEKVGSPMQARIEMKSFSLKTLEICNGLGEAIKSIVLLTNQLKCLSLSGGDFELVELMQEKGCSSMQHLVLKHVHISVLQLGASASLLHGLELIGDKISYDGCGYYKLFRESKNLQNLRLVGCFDVGDCEDWLELVGSSPHLRRLAIDYGVASRAFEINSSTEYLIMDKVVILELSCDAVDEDFARCVAGFLKRCPNLKQLMVTGSAPRVEKGCPARDLNRFCSTLVEIMRPYPHIDFKVNLS